MDTPPPLRVLGFDKPGPKPTFQGDGLRRLARYFEKVPGATTKSAALRFSSTIRTVQKARKELREHGLPPLLTESPALSQGYVSLNTTQEAV